MSLSCFVRVSRVKSPSAKSGQWTVAPIWLNRLEKKRALLESESREAIFEKFGTLSARTNRAYHSVGLGLAFCKLAVEAHGGSIGVDDGARVGSIFWFQLPVEHVTAA
jgi:light-regulated signal transduction histidine kinase (bacteriophytochrome)